MSDQDKLLDGFDEWATEQGLIIDYHGVTAENMAIELFRTAWQASAARSSARIAELEDVADKLYQSLQEVLQMQVNGHDLQDRMQFSMPGRAIGGKAYAARKLYEAMKGGA